MPEPTPSRRDNIFFGDDGLRAGWSIALFLAPFLIVFALGWIVVHSQPESPAQAVSASDIMPGDAIAADGLPFIFVAIVAYVMSLIERRSFARYGLGIDRRVLPDLAAGLAWGLLTLSLFIAALWITHAIAFDGLALHGASALSYALEWAFAFLCVGLFEEFLFRGYLQYTLSRGIAGIVRTISPRNPHSHAIGFWLSAFLLGCVFAATHISNDGETSFGIVAVACAGAVFAFTLWRTGSLWWAVGFHAAWDWAQSFLYGTPDSGNLVRGHLLATHPLGSQRLSGGSAGPEGSVLVIPALLFAAIVIHLTLPRRDYQLTPDRASPQRTPPHPQSTV